MGSIGDILGGFITYVLPLISFIYQLWKDNLDKKEVKELVETYNNSNSVDIDIKNINIQNGNLEINTTQNISFELRNELKELNKERLENLRFLSINLYRISFVIILCLFFVNTFIFLRSENIGFNKIFEHDTILKLDIFKASLVFGINETIQNSFTIATVYSVLILIKYIIQKNIFVGKLVFIIISVCYVISIFYLRIGILNKINYLDLVFVLLLKFAIIFTIFFAINIFIYRLFGLQLKYKSSIKSSIVNCFQTFCTILPPLIVILLQFLHTI